MFIMLTLLILCVACSAIERVTYLDETSCRTTYTKYQSVYVRAPFSHLIHNGTPSRVWQMGPYIDIPRDSISPLCGSISMYTRDDSHNSLKSKHTRCPIPHYAPQEIMHKIPYKFNTSLGCTGLPGCGVAEILGACYCGDECVTESFCVSVYSMGCCSPIPYGYPFRGFCPCGSRYDKREHGLYRIENYACCNVTKFRRVHLRCRSEGYGMACAQDKRCPENCVRGRYECLCVPEKPTVSNSSHQETVITFDGLYEYMRRNFIIITLPHDPLCQQKWIVRSDTHSLLKSAVLAYNGMDPGTLQVSTHGNDSYLEYDSTLHLWQGVVMTACRGFLGTKEHAYIKLISKGTNDYMYLSENYESTQREELRIEFVPLQSTFSCVIRRLRVTLGYDKYLKPFMFYLVMVYVVTVTMWVYFSTVDYIKMKYL